MSFWHADKKSLIFLAISLVIYLLPLDVSVIRDRYRGDDTCPSYPDSAIILARTDSRYLSTGERI